MVPDHPVGAASRKPNNSNQREDVTRGAGADRAADRLDKEAELMDSLERKLNEKVMPQRVNNIANNSGIIANDQTQCKIIAANKKMLFIVSKDNFLYKRDCLTKAKQVRIYYIFLVDYIDIADYILIIICWKFHLTQTYIFIVIYWS